MKSSNLRSWLGTVGRRTTDARGRVSNLVRAVGRAIGADQAPQHGGVIEGLEDRQMLEGSFATAIVVNLNGQGRGNSAGAINPSQVATDNDFYTFTATGNDFVRVLADTANETPASTLNTRVSVYSAPNFGSLVATGTNNGQLTSGLQRDGWVGFIAQAGHQYYVVVASDYPAAGPNLTTGNTYNLQVAATSKTFDLWTTPGIGIEAGSPQPNPPLVPATPILDSLTQRQEDVVYKYVAPSDTAHNSLVTVNAQFTNYAPGRLPNSTIPDRMDTRVEIYSATGTLIAADSDAGRINDAFTAFKATPGATYYFRIRSDEVRPRNVNNPAFDVSLATGPFFLVIDTVSTNLPLNPVRRVGSDPNGAFDGFGDPTTPPVPNIPAPTFQTALYDFTSQADGLAFVTVQPTGLAPVTDPAVRVFDASGNLIGFNDNYAGLSAELQIRIVGGQKYYIVVDGFEINSAVQFTLNIEATHTFNPSNGQPTTDDHVNTPTQGTLDQIRRRFNEATALTWGPSFPTLDADNNVVRDRGVRVTATGTGRLWTAGDTDLFQFVPQVDMLINYGGNNDDAGTSLFMGGVFDTADPGTAWPVGSRNLSIWDASDYWFTGAQFFDQANNVTYGFNDNADTAGTAGPEIYVLQDWDTDPTTNPNGGFTDHALVVGGDFDLIIPTPFGPQTIKNLAFWVQDPNTGRFGWATLGDANAPVRAATIFDPTPWTQSTAGVLPADTLGQGLILGGDFTDIGGTPVARVAHVSLATGIAALGAGIGAGSVMSFAVWNPDFQVQERAASAGPPPLVLVTGTRNTPQGGFLWIGGQFGAGTVNNLRVSDGFTTPVDPGTIFHSISRGNHDFTTDGPIQAMTVATFTEEDPTVTPPTVPPTLVDKTQLVFAGNFTQAGGAARAGIARVHIAGTWDQQAPGYDPFLEVRDITDNDTGIAGANIHALAVWDPPDINNGTIDPVLVVGGEFANFNGLNNIIALDTFDGTDGANGGWGWFSNGTGPQGAVRALATVDDDQEPGIATNLVSGVPQQVLYVGGDFTHIDDGSPAGLDANHVVQYSAFTGPFGDFFAWSAMANGVDNTQPGAPGNATIFALSAFDDGNPLEWDRHDRRQTRLAVTVSPSDGSFINSRVRVFDSNFNIVYGFDKPGSETIAPPFPDPSGMIDESLSAPGADTQLEGIPLWGGQTYYIEVSGTGTGRYTVNVTADALPTDLNGDGVLDDVNAVYVEEPNEGSFTSAIPIGPALGTGDGLNFVASDTAPLHGNGLRQQKINPSTGFQFTSAFDLGNIETIDDTDLYLFRAEFTGNVEVRLSTSLLDDRYGETYDPNDALRGLQSGGSTSLLDGAIRVFRNDFEQIAYNDDNAAMAGEYTDTHVGDIRDANNALIPFRFFSRDPRVVIPVVAGNTYYIQVESGAKYKLGSPQLVDDRVPNITREVDIRRATGGYLLLLNAMPQQANDVENGNTVQDDHFDTNPNNPTFTLATPINIGDLSTGLLNGTGSVTGIINDTPFQPDDVDSFTFIAPGTGSLVVSLTRPSGSTLDASIILFSIDPITGATTQVASGNPTNTGGQVIFASATKGVQYGVTVKGSGGSEGAYTLDVSGIPEVDDYADFAKLADAQDITLRDFLGQGNISGSIEEPGDTDLFRFAFPDFFATMTITVTALDGTLDPTVTVYEVSEDPAANPIILKVGFNDNAANGTTTARVLTPVSPAREKAGPPVRQYPYYYIVVGDANPSGGFGRYSISLSFPPTDDHPDGDTNADGALDTGEYSLATPIVIDSQSGLGSSTGNIEIDSDSDLLRFSAPAGGVATVTLNRPANSTLRLKISVLDAQGNLIATQTGADDLNNLFVAVNVPVIRNQNYFVVVQGFDDINNPNTVTTLRGAWSLSVQAPPIDDHPNAGEFSLASGDQIFFNTTTGIAQLGGDVAGDPSNSRLSPTNDTDLVTFAALLAGNQQIRLTPFAAAGGFKPVITIFDANQTQIGQVTGTAALEQLTFTVNASAVGTRFYILVSAVNDGITPMTGEYAITITGPVPSSETGGPDPTTIDFNAPTTIALNGRTGFGSRFDTISPVGDRDLFTFTTTAAGRVFVQVVTPSGSTLDASVRILRNPNELQNSEVTFNADGIPGTTASTSFVGTAGTQYWVVVDGLGDSTGTYEIRVQTQPITNTLYFPEGFASNNVREFLSIVNPNAVDANYTVYLRYETGDVLQTVVTNGIVRANSRDGLTIKDGPAYSTPNLIEGTPYSIILESDQPLGATVAHYDFGNAIGDSMTGTTSPTWLFPRVERSPGAVKDFVTFYNPNPFDITVTMTAYQNGTPFTLIRNFAAQRRGGFSIDDVTEFPLGTFGLSLSATPLNSANNSAFIGIVASISHYTPGGTSGWAALGEPTSGTTVGAMPNITNGPKISGDVNFFNPSDVAVTVTLTGTYVRETLPQFGRTFDIPAKSLVSFTNASLGLLTDQPAGLVWHSTGPIVAINQEQQQGDSDATSPITQVGTQFRFGDAFINPAEAGHLNFETLYIYNPTGLQNTVTINLVFLDGTSASFTTNVRAGGFAEVKLHERAEILNRSGPQWFGVDVSSTLPFAVDMVHFDLAVNGGYAAAGIPLGLLNPLSKLV